MNNITLKLNEMAAIYKELEGIAKESFAALKTKNLAEEKAKRLEEQRKFKEILTKKNEIQELLLASSPTGEPMTLTEYTARIEDVSEREQVERSTKELLTNAGAFRQQIRMNIEMAAALRDVHAMKVETAIEIVKRDNIDKSGPILLDEDY